MDPSTWDAVCTALDTAMTLPEPARARYLDSLNAPDVAAEAKRLLHHADAAHPLLDVLNAQGPTLVEQLLLLRGAVDWPEAGTLLGAYRLDERVGEGGHGAVYRARDTDADRTVAVKLLASRREDVYTRLRREIRALARLDHPGVARFFSAGQTEDGRAYFAMEWVDGPPITAFADAHGLGFDARLGLLVQAAEAVQHVHQRLVLHRDLKPANVLVVDTSAGPRVKVIDLGIGTLTDEAAQASGDAPEDAPAPYLRLTPAYAAPEQLRGEPASVASDVYSLGVLGRELLFSPDPPASERTRDVEAVLARALEPAASDRYATVADLAADLRRAAEDRPVSARPVGQGERARRFVRRHRPRVLLFGSIAAAFLLASGYYVWSVRQARAHAEQEAAAANEAMAMLTGVFRNADPFSERTDTLRARQIVDAAAQTYRTAPPATDEVRVRMACTLAGIYTDLQVFEPARPLFDVCLAPGAAGPVTEWKLEAQRKRVLVAYNDSDTTLALRLGRQTVHEAAEAFGTRSASYVRALAALAKAYSGAQRYDSSEARWRQAAATARQVLEPRSVETAGLIAEHGHALGILNREDDAQALLKEALALYTARYGPGHPAVVTTLDRLGLSYYYAGRPDEARRTLEQALATARTVRDGDHPSILETESHLGQLLFTMGERAEGVRRMRSAYERQRVRLGPDNTYVLFKCSALGAYEFEAGYVAEGEARLSDCLARATRTLGPDDMSTLLLALEVGRLHLATGRFDACERLFRDLAPRFVRADPNQTHDWVALRLAGECRLRQGGAAHAQTAERDARAVLQGLRADPSMTQNEMVDAEVLLGRTLAAQQRWAEAERVLRERQRRVATHLPDDSAAAAAAVADLRALRARTFR